MISPKEIVSSSVETSKDTVLSPTETTIIDVSSFDQDRPQTSKKTYHTKPTPRNDEEEKEKDSLAKPPQERAMK
jgi:hypothetical protein